MCRAWRGYDGAGVGGGGIHLAVDTTSEDSLPLLEITHTHTHLPICMMVSCCMLWAHVPSCMKKANPTFTCGIAWDFIFSLNGISSGASCRS